MILLLAGLGFLLKELNATTFVVEHSDKPISANLIQHFQHVWSCVQGSQASHERDACGPDKEEHCHGSSGKNEEYLK